MHSYEIIQIISDNFGAALQATNLLVCGREVLEGWYTVQSKPALFSKQNTCMYSSVGMLFIVLCVSNEKNKSQLFVYHSLICFKQNKAINQKRIMT